MLHKEILASRLSNDSQQRIKIWQHGEISCYGIITVTDRMGHIAIPIGNPARNTSKRAVWIDGGNHAREWPAFHTAAFFIHELVSKYSKDAEITNYVDKLNIYVSPVLNPDGFEFSRTSDVALIRHWRKNRAPENCSGSILFRKNLCCDGVDLNRNYDFDFRQTLYPYNNPCSDEYQGPYPFSEPESRHVSFETNIRLHIAVRDIMTSAELRGKVDAVISMHTHGQLIILPYNHRRNTYPSDYADLVCSNYNTIFVLNCYMI
ncbi:unnamed protein product [Gongylonema pulchrum]|uniref:Peptidase_M14 domain-containing protein n=1 Tax=Gongylonema pulchrum TaxID=637853 RepID=A0A183D3H0_9BILA|nr:unnamed protein product [Gongylonema pulchrum]